MPAEGVALYSTMATIVQGQGKHTERKEGGILACLLMSLMVSRAAKVIAYPYWHIDLTAGSGWNDKAGCAGSPLVFYRALKQAQRPAEAFFIDLCQSSIYDLRARLRDIEGGNLAHCWEGDNAVLLPRIADRIRAAERRPELAIGTCICDPNGFPDGFPIEPLVEFSEQFPRIDLIFNLNVSLFAMVRGCKRSASERLRKQFKDWPEMGELIDRFPRRHWWVRNPPPHGSGNRFITFYGHNWPRGHNRPFADFLSLDSPQGQSVLASYRREDAGQGYFSFMWGKQS